MTDLTKHSLELLTPLRSLVELRHVGGARKNVELVGFSRSGPKRALIHWPGAGQYEIALEDGRIIGMPPTLTACWRVPNELLERLRASEVEARPARGRRRGSP